MQGLDPTRHFRGWPFRLLDTFRLEAEELERRLLERRGFGQQREGMFFGVRYAHGVACHGAKMIDKAGKAVDAIAIGVALDCFFGLCRG